MNGSSGSVMDEPSDGLTFMTYESTTEATLILRLGSSIAPSMMYMNHDSMYTKHDSMHMIFSLERGLKKDFPWS